MNNEKQILPLTIIKDKDTYKLIYNQIIQHVLCEANNLSNITEYITQLEAGRMRLPEEYKPSANCTSSDMILKFDPVTKGVTGTYKGRTISFDECSTRSLNAQKVVDKLCRDWPQEGDIFYSLDIVDNEYVRIVRHIVTPDVDKCIHKMGNVFQTFNEAAEVRKRVMELLDMGVKVNVDESK